MESEVTEQKINQIILDDKSRYFYSVKPVEITNALGVVIAVLDEYFITNTSDESYKLYKTNEGNWYDIPDTIPFGNNVILRTLKLAIDNKQSLKI